MTPEEIFAKHELNAADPGDLGTICVGCLEPFPCDAFLIACAMEEQRLVTSKLIADLIVQRDACLEQL